MVGARREEHTLLCAACGVLCGKPPCILILKTLSVSVSPLDDGNNNNDHNGDMTMLTVIGGAMPMLTLAMNAKGVQANHGRLRCPKVLPRRPFPPRRREPPPPLPVRERKETRRRCNYLPTVLLCIVCGVLCVVCVRVPCCTTNVY